MSQQEKTGYSDRASSLSRPRTHAEVSLTCPPPFPLFTSFKSLSQPLFPRPLTLCQSIPLPGSPTAPPTPSAVDACLHTSQALTSSQTPHGARTRATYCTVLNRAAHKHQHGDDARHGRYCVRAVERLRLPRGRYRRLLSFWDDLSL